MKKPEKLQHGRVVWLRYIRPAGEPVEIKNIPKPPVVVASKTKNETIKEPNTPKKETQLAEQKKTPGTTTSTPKPEKQIAQLPVKQEKPVAEEDTNTIILPTQAQPVETTFEDVASAETENSIQTHTVTTGQTLFAIAKLYKVAVNDLRLWNNLQQSDGINVGQTLLIKKSAPSKPGNIVEGNEFIEYTVQTGDSLYKIAREHGVSVQELATWNSKTDYGLAVGEKIRIKPAK